jgi:hypothetical protein
MDIELSPEPPPEEREALEHSLARLLEEPGAEPSAWWRAGVRENLSPEEEPA